jgi:hypothetical protein
VKREWLKPLEPKSLDEAKAMLADLVRLGNQMSLEMQRQMLLGIRDEEFHNAQHNWKQYLCNRALPSSNGAPAPASSRKSLNES